MLKLQLAVPTADLGLPFHKALTAAARLGVAAVEVDARHEFRPEDLSQTALRQIRKLLDDARLRVAAVRFCSRRGYAVEDALDARVEATKRAMQTAYALGASVLVGNIGPVPAQEDADRQRLLVEVLGDLGRYGLKVGVFFATETDRQEVARLKPLLEALDNGLLGVALQPGHLVLDGQSPVAAVEALGHVVRHVYASDAIDGGRRNELVRLGTGSVDYPALLAALEQRDYRGYFTLCASQAESPAAQWTAAAAFLKSL